MSLRHRMLLICFIFIAGEISFSAQSSNEFESQLSNCELIIGWDPWPPYQYLDKNNQPAGIQIDLVKSVASRAGCQLKFVQQTFSENLHDVASGKIQLVLGTTITKRRKQYAHFSRPYRKEILALYSTSQFHSLCQNSSLEDLVKSGMRIGIQSGSYYGEELLSLQKEPSYQSNIIVVPHTSELYQLITTQKIDALVDDPIVVAYRQRQNDFPVYLKSCNLIVYSVEISMMFSKKSVSETVVANFNKALEDMMQTSDYKKTWSW